MEEGKKKRENRVRFQGMLVKNPRIFPGLYPHLTPRVEGLCYIGGEVP